MIGDGRERERGGEGGTERRSEREGVKEKEGERRREREGGRKIQR